MHSFKFSIGTKNLEFKSHHEYSNIFGADGSTVEPETRSFFENIIKPEDIVFDIGANIGFYTALFSQKTNQTFAFEPTSTYDEFLLPNLLANNISNVEV